MSGSDDGRILPSITRRRLMTGAAAASITWPFGLSAHENTPRKVLREDPSFRLCERWREMHDNTLALCRKQQSLEADLVRTIGFPSIQERRSNGGEVTIRSINDLPEDNAIQSRASADLAAHQARWDAMDDQIGYSRMDAMIRQSEALEQAILDDLLRSPALTIDVVLAKLSVILCEAENREDPDDFPWSHIRAVRNDLARLHGLDIDTL
ncbi:hypothetical protein ACFWXH_22090 [Mesorhizobium sp. NPDC059054]|uniref:hypothetical protein n=1 Tax=Mesorhizobium sp. NPDC059054 TaxID=3346711 RepID=UPI00367DB5DB